MKLDEVRSLFLKSISQKTAVFTPVVMSLTQNWVKMVQICIQSTNGYRKMKVNSKGKFEVKYSVLLFEATISKLYTTGCKNIKIKKNIPSKRPYRSSLIFLLQIVFDISFWFHFDIILILLSPFAQDMQFWASKFL